MRDFSRRRDAFFFANLRNFNILDCEIETPKCFMCERETFRIFKGPLKYLVAKLHGCYPNATSLPVSQNIFARFCRRRPVADSSRSCLFFFTSLQQTQEKLFVFIFIDKFSTLRLQHVSRAFIFET